MALGVAAAVFVAGGVAWLQTRSDDTLAPTPAPKQQSAPVTESKLKPGGELEPAARRVAARFIETAVGRQELDVAWTLATAELRSGLTLKQWLTGDLPVAPFALRNLETTGFDVVESAPNKVLLQVLLVPKPGTEYVPTRYDMTVVRSAKDAPWKVSYCAPYAPPGIYVEPE